MNILKFKVFTQEAFEKWQRECPRKISQASPFVSGVTAYAGDNNSGTANTDPSVFVLYWEDDLLPLPDTKEGLGKLWAARNDEYNAYVANYVDACNKIQDAQEALDKTKVEA